MKHIEKKRNIFRLRVLSCTLIRFPTGNIERRTRAGGHRARIAAQNHTRGIEKDIETIQKIVPLRHPDFFLTRDTVCGVLSAKTRISHAGEALFHLVIKRQDNISYLFKNQIITPKNTLPQRHTTIHNQKNRLLVVDKL